MCSAEPEDQCQKFLCQPSSLGCAKMPQGVPQVPVTSEHVLGWQSPCGQTCRLSSRATYVRVWPQLDLSTRLC